MQQNIKNSIGYLFNAFSIGLFPYLVFVLNVPDVLRPLFYLGWFLLGLSICLITLSLIAFAKNKSRGLIKRGIYGIVRHPMYLGALMSFFSYFLFCPHWVMLSLSLINAVIIYRFILQGERENIAKFGGAYERYMKTVPQINLVAGIIRRLKTF